MIRANPGTAAGLVIGAGVLVIALAAASWFRSNASFYVLAASIGAGLGIAEVAGRYRDDPAASVLTIAGLLYIAINAGASVAALALLRVFQPEADPDFKSNLTQALGAGFGAMAVFRSSLFTARIGNTDIGIGPASFLKVILDAVDSAVDRKRGPKRGDDVARIMKEVSFDKASESLPTVCFRMLLNVSESAVNSLSLELSRIKTSTMPDDHKAIALGLALLPVVGESVLERAVALLGKQIQRDRRLTISSVETLILLQRIRSEADFMTLGMACQTLMENVSAADVDFITAALDGMTQHAKGIGLPFRRLMFASRLVSQFGEAVVREALRLLPDAPAAETAAERRSEGASGSPAVAEGDRAVPVPDAGRSGCSTGTGSSPPETSRESAGRSEELEPSAAE